MQNGKGEKPAKISESASGFVEKIFGEMTRQGKALSSLKEKASEWGLDELADEIKNYVKKHPLKSVGIAAGLGFLLNSLLRSPSRRGE